MKIRKFELRRDDHGFCNAVSVAGWYVVQLDRGTVRNEENADKLVYVLNAAVAVVHKEAGVVRLRKALENIMPKEKAGAHGRMVLPTRRRTFSHDPDCAIALNGRHACSCMPNAEAHASATKEPIA